MLPAAVLSVPQGKAEAPPAVDGCVTVCPQHEVSSPNLSERDQIFNQCMTNSYSRVLAIAVLPLGTI